MMEADSYFKKNC